MAEVVLRFYGFISGGLHVSLHLPFVVKEGMACTDDIKLPGTYFMYGNGGYTWGICMQMQ